MVLTEMMVVIMGRKGDKGCLGRELGDFLAIDDGSFLAFSY